MSWARKAKAIAAAIARNAADAIATASVCGALASTNTSAVRKARAIAGAIARSAAGAS